MRNPLNYFTKAAPQNVSVVSLWAQAATWQMTGAFLPLVRKGYKQNSVAYACIKLLRESVAEPPCNVYRAGRGGMEPADASHPLQRLIQRPNPKLTEFGFWELVVTHLSITGASYWWKERGRGGQVVALWPLRPDRMGPLYSGTGLRAWQYVIGAEEFEVPPADIVYFSYPDPEGESSGLYEAVGPLQILAREVDSDNEATGFVKAMLENYAIPGVILKLKRRVPNADEARQIRDRFRRQYGRTHRGEPAIVDEDADVVPVSHSLRELEFPDLRAINETRIAAAFGTPPILVGLKVGLDHATMANMAESREYFAETTCATLWRRLSDALTLDLAAEFDASLVCRFDTSVVKALQRQHSDRAERFRVGLVAGAVQVNEYRAVLSLPPVPAGDVFVRDLRLIEVSPVTGALPFLPAPAPVVAGRLLPPGRKALAIPASWEATVVAERAMVAQPTQRRLDSMLDQLAADMVLGIRERVQSGMSWRRKEDTADPRGVLPADAADLLPTDVAQRFDDALRPGWTAAVEMGRDNAMGLVGAFDLPMTEVNRVTSELATRITGIVETTREQVRAVVAQKLTDGASIADIRDALRGMYREAYAGRSETIARTESAVAYNQGSILAYRESGLVKRVTVYDGDYDSVCQGLNGTTQTLDWAASNPVQHPRCTRAFAPIVE